jgi:hypothetical protein
VNYFLRPLRQFNVEKAHGISFNRSLEMSYDLSNPLITRFQAIHTLGTDYPQFNFPGSLKVKIKVQGCSYNPISTKQSKEALNKTQKA